MNEELPTESDGPVVFFDGVCGLCNTSVDFFMRHDRHARLRFAPLQGDTAAGMLAKEDRENLNSMVFVSAESTFRKSAAVVRILNVMGGGWKLVAGLLWIVPWPIRDLGYTLVAKTRYRLFGKKDACRLPTPQEAGRLLP